MTTPSTHKVSKATFVKVADLQALLTTAVEGGINYWAPAASSVERDEDLNVTAILGLVVPDMTAEDVGIDAVDGSYDDGWNAGDAAIVTRIDHHVMRHGLALVLDMISDGRVHPNSEIGSQVLGLMAVNELDCADATVADAVLQAGLFGEIVFG